MFLIIFNSNVSIWKTTHNSNMTMESIPQTFKRTWYAWTYNSISPPIRAYTIYVYRWTLQRDSMSKIKSKKRTELNRKINSIQTSTQHRHSIHSEERDREHRIKETQIRFARVSNTPILCSTVLKWQLKCYWNRAEIHKNALSRPAAYSQLTPNFGWIECITSTHEARQRDTKMMKNTGKKKHNINTQQNITLTHSLTRHIQRHGVFASSEARYVVCRRCVRFCCRHRHRYIYRAFPIWRLVSCFILSVLLRMSVDVCCCVYAASQRLAFINGRMGLACYCMHIEWEKKEADTHTSRTMGKGKKWENERNTNGTGESKQALIVTPFAVCVAQAKTYLRAMAHTHTHTRWIYKSALEKRMAGNRARRKANENV